VVVELVQVVVLVAVLVDSAQMLQDRLLVVVHLLSQVLLVQQAQITP
jgi:hypothetical protein